MGGPNLEVFKFAVYVTFPFMLMLHYSNPEWYARHVLPYKDRIFPPEENIVRELPNDKVTLRQELARIKAERLAKKAQREAAAHHASS